MNPLHPAKPLPNVTRTTKEPLKMRRSSNPGGDIGLQLPRIMPNAARKPCSKSGCKELSTGRFCDLHAPTEATLKNKYRGSSTERGYGSDWQKVRLQALQRDKYLCQHHLPTPVPALDVHHIQMITDRPDLRLVLANLVSLCRECHSKIPTRKI